MRAMRCGWMAAVTLAAGFLLAFAPAAPAAEMEDLDAAQAAAVRWCQVRDLRQDLHLADADLATIGCSEAGAETVLSALASWFETNASGDFRG